MGCLRIPKPELMRIFLRGRETSVTTFEEFDASLFSTVSRLVFSGFFNTTLSVRVSFDFGGFVVFIRLLLVVPMVLNWACVGMARNMAQTDDRMSLLVFMLQRYDTILE